MHVVFYNKLSWFVSELPEKDILNLVVFAGNILRHISCRGLDQKISQTLR